MDDPHGGQFGKRECLDCHTESLWTDLDRFSHDATRYPLTGSHAETPCASCHTGTPGWAEGESGAPTTPPRLYAGLPFSECGSCHQDPHSGTHGGACSTCHTTGAWLSVSRSVFETAFDHRVTGFLLSGAHATAGCGTCHKNTARRDDLQVTVRRAARTPGYPVPAVEDGCESCHRDPHAGELAGSGVGPDCAECHGQRVWTPTTFDASAHQTTGFPLEGAHQAVRCSSCHIRAGPTGRLILSVEDATCAGCHREDDPHGEQFAGRGCEGCHQTRSGFRVPEFDHSATRFPLEGGHRDVVCAACHATVEAPGAPSRVTYRPLPTDCQDCHEGSP